MSGNISDEIKRIQDAKLNIKAAINEKGGAITNELIDKYPDAIRGLASGGGKDRWYEVYNGMLRRKGFNSKGMEDVIIPSELDGQKITSIGRTTFDSASHSTSDTARKLIISEGIKEIGDYAFKDAKCQTLILPSTIKRIGMGAFDGAILGKNALILPDSITYIDSGAFEWNSATSIKLPDNASISIGGSAFKDTFSLESVDIPGTIGIISYSMFENGRKLKNVTINEGIKSIKSNAFKNCIIESIYIPDSVKKIEYNAFYGNPLKTVSIPSTCTYASDAFPSTAVITKREV